MNLHKTIPENGGFRPMNSNHYDRKMLLSLRGIPQIIRFLNNYFSFFVGYIYTLFLFVSGRDVVVGVSRVGDFLLARGGVA